MTHETQPESRQIEVRAVWPEGALNSAQVTNQFALVTPPATSSGEPDEGLYVLLGHVGPPLWGTEEDAAAASVNGRFEMPIQMNAALYMSRARAEELARALLAHLSL